MLIFSSDVEKLGEWPTGDKTTYEICYIDGYEEKPWMEKRNFLNIFLIQTG